MQVTPDTFLQQLSFLKVGKATEVGVGVALGRSKSFGVRQAPPDVKRYNVATPATRRFLEEIISNFFPFKNDESRESRPFLKLFFLKEK